MDLPVEFTLRTKTLLAKEWDSFRSSLEEESPASLRINPFKINEPETLEKVLWSSQGYYMNKRPFYTFDPLFHAGCYYPQEASSMFVEQVIKQYGKANMRVLDLCAAPGGKSTHLLSLLADNSLLVSNEVIRSRATTLAENILKWGKSNVIVSNSDPAVFDNIPNFFDIILVDAPCSGEGMFRKDEKAVKEWSGENVKLCQNRQRRIVSDAWNSLKPGGILIYSTCTYNTLENEENVEWILANLKADPLALHIPENWNITGALKGNLPVYRFLPHKTKGEGFFLAVVRKKETSGNSGLPISGKDNFRKRDKNIFSEYKNYLSEPDKYFLYQENNFRKAFPEEFYLDLLNLSSKLKIVSSGIRIGQVKGKDFIPEHSLAMSSSLNTEAFTRIEIDWKTAIQYLKKENIVLDYTYPRGFLLLQYQGVPLGFIKNIGNRINNLFPQEWRIRSREMPSTPVITGLD